MGTTESLDLQRPTRVRYQVMGYLCALALVLYIDRICIAQATPEIMREFDLSKTDMSLVQNAFMIAYALFEVVTGKWGDRYGSRRVLMRIVLWWSAFTALTGCVWHFSYGFGPSVLVQPEAYESPSGQLITPEAYLKYQYVIFSSFTLLLLIRFLFGAGEAGALPNVARIIVHWFPPGKRGPMQALITVANLAGGTAAPILTAYLMRIVGWRRTFVIFGFLGIIWAFFFRRAFRDNPADHPGVNEAERRLIQGDADNVAPLAGHDHPPIPWAQVFRSPNTWFLGTAMMCAAFYAYMLYSWFPTYLREARKVGDIASGWLTGMVLIEGAVGVMIGGLLGEWLSIRTGSRRNTLRGMGVFGMLLGVPCVAATVHCDSGYLAAFLFGAACFGLNIQLAAWWQTVGDVCGRHLGALFGLMNAMGIIGGMASQRFLAQFVEYRQAQGFLGRAQWDPAFYIYAGILAVGGLLWLGVDASKPIVPDEPMA